MAIKASLELLLIFAGLISTLLIVKGSLMPYSSEIVFSSLVGFWKSRNCFFSSTLYICIIINFMVLLIAASSSLQRHETGNRDFMIDDDPQIKNQNQPRDLTEVDAPQPMTTAKTTLYQGDHSPPQSRQDVIDQICVDERCKFPSGSFSNEALVETIERAMEEKKDVKSENNEEEEEDNMEATWRTIMGGGKEKGTKKKLKKSGTWNLAPPTRVVAVQSHDSEELLQSILASRKELRKSETFNDAVSVRQRGGLRRDPSVSVDEFNNQVEGFIKKFNESIRLQRQESDQRFIDVVNRGL